MYCGCGVPHQAVKEKEVEEEREEEQGLKREGKRKERERGMIVIWESLLQMICCN